MTMNYRYRGCTITPMLAKKLIIELFIGEDAVRRQTMIRVCQDKHVQLGGIPHKDKSVLTGVFKKALTDLRKEGSVESATRGIWHVVGDNRSTLRDESTGDSPDVLSNQSTRTRNRRELEKYGLYYKQKGKCAGCDTSFNIQNLVLDHIQPKSRGGSEEISNLQLLCASCNSIKGDRSHSFLMERLQETRGLPS